MSAITFNAAKQSSRRFTKFPYLASSATLVAGATYLYLDQHSHSRGDHSHSHTNYGQNHRQQQPNPDKNSKSWFLFSAPVYSYVADKKKDQSRGVAEYQRVYNSIAEKIQEYDSYDQGIGFGPALVRLAWHQSGTYTETKVKSGCPVHAYSGSDGSHGVGGSFGGTMRLPREAGDGANNGLQNARWLLEKVKREFPWISHGDLYTLSGVVAIQEMGGPKVGWRCGRENLPEEFQQNNKLPDASRDADYVRGLFKRMGFDDREVVSLIGAHALGSCHVNAPGLPDADGDDGPSTGPGSGYVGRWTAAPNYFSNDFYKLLLDEEWRVKNWAGPKQYVNKDNLMMLPTDIALTQDDKYLKIVKMYAADKDRFFKDFAKDFQKLLELGIDFQGKKSFYFKTLDEQS